MNTTPLPENKIVTAKRGILIDMLDACNTSPHNTELWKLFIDAALDRLDNDIYMPLLIETIGATWDLSREGYNSEYTGLVHDDGARYSEKETMDKVIGEVMEILKSSREGTA